MAKPRNLRPCPAVGGEITARECGENRGTRYSCPATCPYFPFAPENYDEALAIGDRVMGGAMDRLRREVGPHEWERLQREGKALDPGPRHSFWTRRLHFERDAAGLTFMDRWEREGWTGLDNDERFLAGRQRGIGLALIEAQQVLPGGGAVEAIDRLGDPSRRFVIRDRSLAAHVVRFTRFLMWVFFTPHYARALGAALPIPEVEGWTPEGMLAEIARHLGAPETAGAPLRRWLGENEDRVTAALDAVGAAREEAMFRALDARWISTTYRLRGGVRPLKARLRAQADIAPDEPADSHRREGFTSAWDWLEPETTEGDPHQTELPLPRVPALTPGRLVLGTVLLGGGRVRLEATAVARHVRLRRQFENLAGELVEFHSEEVRDVAAQLAQRNRKAYDPALVPPRLLENPRQIELQTTRVPAELDAPADASHDERVRHALRQHYERWLDHPLPIFGGKAPREAARDLALRPRLIEEMKDHVRTADERARREGSAQDVNWVVEELGLREILFPPPPLHPPQSGSPGWGRDAAEDGEDWPDPPTAPLSQAQVQKRIERELGALDRAADAMARIEQEQPALLDTLAELMEPALNATEQSVFVTFALQAYVLLVLGGAAVRPLRNRRLEERFLEAVDALEQVAGPAELGAAVMDATRRSRQPSIAALISSELAAFSVTGPKRDRPRPEVVPVMLALLLAVINEVDCTVAK